MGNRAGGLSDVHNHIRIAQYFEQNNLLPTPTGFYGLMMVLNLVFQDAGRTFLFLLLLMSIAISAKFLIVDHEIRQCSRPSNRTAAESSHRTLGLLLTIGIIVSTPVYYGGNFYLGRFGINIWHNTTTILVVPFCFLIFLKSLKFLNQPFDRAGRSAAYAVGLLSILIALIKPSYLFCFVPAFLLFCVIYIGICRETILALVALLPSIVLIFVIYYYHFVHSDYTVGLLAWLGWPTSEIGLRFADPPFEFFLRHMEPGASASERLLEFTVASVLSLLFPLFCIFAYFRNMKKDKPFLLSILITIFAIIISALFVEGGFRKHHGNFTWQLIISNQILFFAASIFFFRQIPREGRFGLREQLAFLIFLLHGVSGFVYLGRFALVGRYS
jgi:hypothetical protein